MSNSFADQWPFDPFRRPGRSMGMDTPYPELGSTVAKHRRIARNGLATLTREQRRAYGNAVAKAILAKQRSEFMAAWAADARPACASGTAYTTGQEISAAIREQQRRSLLAWPSKQRRQRTDAEWREMYAKAMAEKNRVSGEAH